MDIDTHDTQLNIKLRASEERKAGERECGDW